MHDLIYCFRMLRKRPSFTVVAGFGDQRGVQLLVHAGLTSEEAIQIATLNGRGFVGEK